MLRLPRVGCFLLASALGVTACHDEAGTVLPPPGTPPVVDACAGLPPVTIKNATYVVNGEETYDPRQREWVAGKMTMDITYKLWANNQDVGGTSGTMVLTFQEMDGKPAK